MEVAVRHVDVAQYKKANANFPDFGGLRPSVAGRLLPPYRKSTRHMRVAAHNMPSLPGICR
jgi:hypothetical protein